MKKILLITIVIMFSLNAFSQVNTIINLADKGVSSAQKKKKIKLAESYTTYFTANGESIPMMRVPSDEITSDASSYITLLQTDLTSANTSYNSKQEITNISALSSNLSNIIANDADWVVENYKLEIDLYSKYETKRKKTADSLSLVLKKKEQATKDSIAKADKEKEIALKEAQKLKADSIAKIEKMKDFKFVNVDELSLRDKPSTSGKLMATLGATTWVKVLNGTEIDGYVQVKVGDKTGYVYNSYLVGDIDDITVEGADIEAARDKQVTIINTVSNASVQYLKDSKGNCYYINSAGKKIMVDRSNCN